MRTPRARPAGYHVYIVECAGGTYYTGSTSNLDRRIARHNAGRGAKYVRGKRPVRLVYAKAYRYYKNVLKAERCLKRQTRKQKEQLIKACASQIGPVAVEGADRGTSHGKRREGIGRAAPPGHIML